MDRYHHKQQPGRRRRGTLLLVVLIVLVGSFALLKTGLISTYYTKFNTWMTERRTHLVKKEVKIKKVASSQNETEPQIHFEFYTALPNMHVSVKPTTPPPPEKVQIADASDIEKELAAAVNERAKNQ